MKIDNFICLNGDIWNFFLQKCLLSSPLLLIWLLSKLLNLVARATKRVNPRKNVKNIPPRNHKVDEANTFHTCFYFMLYINCVYVLIR